MLKRIIPILLVLCFVISGCTNSNSTASQNQNITNIKFIIPKGPLDEWSIDEKPIKDCTPSIVVNELLKYPHIYPEGTKLLSLEVKEKIAYVNMSHEFNSYSLGSTGIEHIIFTITDTLCLNKSLGIDGVKFLLDGEEVPIIGEFETDKVIVPDITLTDDNQIKLIVN
ncbi:GerMN domain-containing protein [Lutispora saccharofermentans]|uniref:GerMN domain-containing protein n=1 Tax=Lutispora saccharofermentans TaxID=3024236 RepID=A0ABT1NHJ5_9FIRM|nr:GerMN domain-containing protein [Lutispora saccharofermentans]MCQ1530753.1 GerMN domain-containing protein [Lutispora saccharofermentans]